MKKVVVGISGGVDSAVAAYLLKKQGYDVIGVFMRNWDSVLNDDVGGNPTLNDEICPQEKDYEDAKQVAKQIGIPLKRVDFIKEYWDKVFTYFIDEYKKGRTPNPDILCNKHIKFDSFLNYAMSLDADYIATGHYARVEHGKEETFMLKGLDNNKDQTYFLCKLDQKQLRKTLFPLGELEKKKVREIAVELGLDVASKKDSTGICFIGERDFKEFLQNYIPAKKGEMIDIETNKVVGIHEGIMYHTIGQRKGLNIGGAGDAWYVVGKEYDKNILYVAQGSIEKYLYASKAFIVDVNWINDVENTFECDVKCRYRQKDHRAKVTLLEDGNVMVDFLDTMKAVTPGQACVFYKDDICLGGGTIEHVYDNQGKKEYI